MQDKIGAILSGAEMNLELIMKSRSFLLGIEEEDVPKMEYKTKEEALSIIYDGYTTIPKIYHDVFLDPFKNLIESYDYVLIQKALGEQGLLFDLLTCIHQRSTQDLKSTRAFEETVADLYDGYLSNVERSGIKPPDYQAFSPLVIWSKPENGPYTWPANFGGKFGLKISLVNMPPLYKKNIALWAAIGHEVGGHDILRADKGLLPELGNIMEAELIKHKHDSKLREPVMINGREDYSVAEFAARYWRHTIDETASDVCGLLNLGPASGFGLSLLLIPLRNNKLVNALPSEDVHPFDSLRIILAADVVRSIRDLDYRTAETYADALERIVDNYVVDKNELRLYSRTKNDVYWNAVIPYEGMRETVKIVADTIASTRLNSLENHSLSEINTWANQDEILVQRIVEDLLDGKDPSIDFGPDGQQVFAAHLLAGGIIALMKNTKIETVSENTINSLARLYENNPVWKGFPIRFRGDIYLHGMVPAYKDSQVSMGAPRTDGTI
jgi:hypothetical protein